MSIARHNEKLSARNMDYYYPLQQKRTLITEIAKKHFHGKLIDIGCGEMPYKPVVMNNSRVANYIGVDIQNESYQQLVQPEVIWDGKHIPMPDNEADCAMLIEVLEHVPQPDQVLKEINRVMKRDGVCLVTIPFLWTLHDIPYDEYRYTPFALRRLAEQANFEVIKMESFGGWHASMATLIALYCRRGLNGNRFQSILSKFLFPVVRYLMKKDVHFPKDRFYEGQMITGIWCLLKKK